MVREALSIRIAMDPTLEICGQTDSEASALELVEQCHPDLVLVDISLTSGNGIELVKQIRLRFPDVKTLVVSSYPESLYAERALRAGALGYLNKQESSANVTLAIQTVLQGKKYISAEITQRLVERAIGGLDADASPVERLSDRELEVFQMIGQGTTSSAVAKKLGLSIHTVDTYREKIKQKIGVSNSVELQREAVRWVLEQT